MSLGVVGTDGFLLLVVNGEQFYQEDTIKEK